MAWMTYAWLCAWAAPRAAKKTKMANSLSEDSEMSWDLKSCIASYAQIVYFEVLLEGAVGPQFVG